MEEILIKLGFTKSSDGFLSLIDGKVKYTAYIFNDILYTRPIEYDGNIISISFKFWNAEFISNMVNFEDELKNYISTTTNDVIWTFERASEIAWNVNIQSQRVRNIVRLLIKN